MAEAKFIGGQRICDLTSRERLDRLSDIAGETSNLADLNNIVIGKAWNGGTNKNRAILTMPIEPNTRYVITYSNATFDAVNIFEKANAEDTTTLYSTSINSGYSRVSNASANYLCLQFNKENISKSDFAGIELQVELRDYASPYIPHTTAVDAALRQNFATYVTPEMYGAWGDGVHDDTKALQAALDTGNNVIANGVYLTSSPILMKSTHRNGQKFYFNYINYTGNDYAMKISGRDGYIDGCFIAADNGGCIAVGEGEEGYTYDYYINISGLRAGRICIKMGGYQAVSECVIRGGRFQYGSSGVYFDLANYWVGQVAFKDMNFFTSNDNGGYAFVANGATHPLTGLSVYNVSLEGSHGGFNFVNSQNETPIETLNCFGLRTSEMSITGGYNVLRYTGGGIIRGVMILDACMLSSFDLSLATHMKECFIVQGRIMGESDADVYGMAIGNGNKLSPIRLSGLIQ